MPLVPAASTLPKLPWLTMAIDLVMVTAPKPPGSRTLISPPAAVFEMAPANVLHGAVRLQGLASSPTPRHPGARGLGRCERGGDEKETDADGHDPKGAHEADLL